MRALSRLLGIVREQAERPWRTSPTQALLLWSVPFAFLLGAACLRLFARPLWRTILADEGPMELVQFVFLAAACICSAIAAVALRRAGNQLGTALYTIGFLGLLFVAGEEIAWGQFVLGFETPEALAGVNYKEETSLHNVSSLADAFELGKLAAGAYGVFGAWVLMGLGRRRDVSALDWYVVPIFLSSSFLFVLLMRLSRLTVFAGGDVPAGYGEFEELCFSFGMLAFTGTVARRARSLRPA